MLARANIVYEVGERSDALFIEAGKGENNLGYGIFFSELSFNEDGSLKNWGCWE
jgi:hypothetical protein